MTDVKGFLLANGLFMGGDGIADDLFSNESVSEKKPAFQ